MAQERENHFFRLLTCITESVGNREMLRSGKFVTPNGKSSSLAACSIVSSSGLPAAVNFGDMNELKTPHSAPPESPVRPTVLNPDRRRTSSDTSLGRAKLPQSQQCSNVKCERVAQWRCIGCEKAIYCGKECQEMHWTTGHEDECDGEERNLA